MSERLGTKVELPKFFQESGRTQILPGASVLPFPSSLASEDDCKLGKSGRHVFRLKDGHIDGVKPNTLRKGLYL